MANFVFLFLTCALFVVVVCENQFCYQNPNICGQEAGCQPVGKDGYVCLCHDLLPAGANNSCDRSKGADGIPSNERTTAPPEKEVEDFTDSEYIPVVDKESINTTDDLKDKFLTKISPSPPPQSAPFPGNVSASTSENVYKNTISGQSSSVAEATSVSSAPEVQRILSKERSTILYGKEIEDFTDSEYIPEGDKENISTTDDLKDESSTKISSSFPSKSTPFPEVKVSVSTSENESQNTIKEQSNFPTEATSISSEKTQVSFDTSVTTNELSSTPEEKQRSSTEDLNISDEINTSTSNDGSTNSNDASSTPNVSTNLNDINSTTDASTRSDDASFSTDVSNDKPDSSSVSGISVSPTSGITSSSENSSLVTDLSTSNSDSTSGEVSQFSTSDATPVSKDASTLTSTPTFSKDASTITPTPRDLSSTIVSLKSTASTEELVSNTVFTVTTSEATSKDIIETTVSSDEPYIDKSTTITEVTSSQSSITTTPTSTTSEVTEDHLQHITVPGLKKVKIGLAITFLTVAVIAMAGIIIYMIKMRKTTIDYEELSLVP